MNRNVRMVLRSLLIILGCAALLEVTLATRGQVGAPQPGRVSSGTADRLARTSEIERHLALGGAEPLPAGLIGDGETVLIPVVGIAKSNLVDTFDQARAGHQHNAIDIMAPRGTPVVAAVDGSILKLFTSAAGGLTIYLGNRDKTLLYYYAHLDRYADGLAPGMSVNQGTVIGYVGSTGNASPDAPHLHFEIERLPPTGEWWKGEPTNPYPVLMEHGKTVQPG